MTILFLIVFKSINCDKISTVVAFVAYQLFNSDANNTKCNG